MEAKGMSHIQKLREERNYSQLMLALELDLNQSTISALEKGVRGERTIGLLTKLADYFDVSVDYLIGRTEVRKDLAAEDLQLAYRINHLTNHEVSKSIKAIIDQMEALMDKP